MLNRNKTQTQTQTLINFSADVFMCELRGTGSGLTFWNLRLLNKGVLIDAFHWNCLEKPVVKYQPNDFIMVQGRWTVPERLRFQVIHSKIVTAYAANDDEYNPNNSQQLELDFGERAVNGS